VIQHGLGTTGKRAVELMVEKEGIEIVGAIARRKEKAGKDLGEVVGLGRKLGVVVSNDLDAVISETVADVVLDATYSRTREVYPYLVKGLERKLNWVTIAEELCNPWFQEPKLAGNIDRLAKRNGVTVLATGANPGFALDALPVFFSSACGKLKKIRARRAVDAAIFADSPVVVGNFGIGLTPGAYKKKEEAGAIFGHTGFPESVSVVAKALGWEGINIERTHEPMIAKVSRDFSPHLIIEPGQVVGSREICRATKDGEEVINFELAICWGFDPATDGIEAGFTCWLEGEPNIEITVKGIAEAGLMPTVTVSRAINLIPYVVKARPGMLNVTEVGLGSYLR